MNRLPLLLLVAGPMTAITAFLVDAQISRAFVGVDVLTSTRNYYIFGSALGILVQGMLAWTMDRGQSARAPLSYRAIVVCGALDIVSIVAWLYALLTGPTAAVLALGSLAPVLVGTWEMVVGRLGFARGLVGAALILGGVGCLLLPASGAALPPACAFALLVRNGTRALTEVWERRVSLSAAYRFTGARFALMATLGIPLALSVGSGSMPTIPAWAVGLQVLSHVLWFGVNVVRVQLKQTLPLVTLPAAAFATPAAGSALAASLLNLALPGSFPMASFSLSLLCGVLLLVAGTAWFTTARAGATRSLSEGHGD